MGNELMTRMMVTYLAGMEPVLEFLPTSYVRQNQAVEGVFTCESE